MRTVITYYTGDVTPLLGDLESRAHENWAKIQASFESCKEKGYSYLVDECRAHDNYILQWVTSLGFDRLFTDFASLPSNQNLSAAPQPMSKIDKTTAKKVWIDFMTGQLKLDNLMKDSREGQGVCLAAPEGSAWTHGVVRVIQDNLLMMLKTGKWYKLGFIMNVHRFPVDDNNMQQVFFGLQLYQNMLLDQAFWPFIDCVQVMQDLKPGQFKCGSGDASVVRNSHYMIAICTSDNQHAQHVLRVMTSVPQPLNQNNFFMGWGHHRVDPWHADKCFNDGTDLRHPTWKCGNYPFPHVQLMADPNHVPQRLEVDDFAVEGRLSMDIPESILCPNRHQMEELIESYTVPQDLADTTQVFIDPNFRRSYGNWGQDRCRAWDITVSGKQACDKNTLRYNTYKIALSLWEHFVEWNPLIGNKDMLNLDQRYVGPYTFMVEFNFMEALQQLTAKNIVAWTLVVGMKHAMVTFCEENSAGEAQPVTAGVISGIINKIRKFNQENIIAQNQNTWKKGCIKPIKLSISKLMCSKCKYTEDVVKGANLLMDCDPDARLLYDRYLDKDRGGRNSSYHHDMYGRQTPLVTKTSTQVLLTLTEFAARPFSAIPALASGLQDVFQTMANQAYLPNLPDGGSRGLTVSLKNHMAGLMTTEEEAVAEYFCKVVISQQIKVYERLAGVQFSSSHHHMLPTQLRDSMLKLRILDQQQGPGHETGPED